MNPQIELSVTIGTVELLNKMDTEPFDSFYLGNPFCLKIRGNLLSDIGILKSAIGILKSRHKKVYLTTPVIATASDFKMVENLLQFGARENIDAVEVHDVGILRAAAKYALRIHLSVFGNVYNRLSALKFSSLGVERVVPSQELTLSEIAELGSVPRLDLELPIHGKLPLGIASTCLLRAKHSSQRETSIPGALPCRQECAAENFLEFEGLKIRTKGSATFTGADLVMIEHLPLLLKQGYKNFRVEGLWETGETLSKLGQVYNEAFRDAARGKTDPRQNLEQIKQITPHICNGWYFGQSGQEYISTKRTV